MATLTVNGRDYEAECGFRFSKLADKKYSHKEKESDKDNGFNIIFSNLIEYENDYLVAFWDCAIKETGKDKPKIEEIESALEERFESDGGTEEAFKEAYRAIDESDFFGKKVQKYWSNYEMLKNFGKTEEDKEQNQVAYERMMLAKADIEG